VRELVVRRATLWQNAALKAAHIEEQVGVVLAVHRHEAVLPQSRRHRPRQAVLDVPEHGATTAQRHRSTFIQQHYEHNHQYSTEKTEFTLHNHGTEIE